jgi:hypothetical protein
MRKSLWFGSLLGGSVAAATVIALSYFGSHPSALIARTGGLLPRVIGQSADDVGVDCGVEMCAPDEPCPASELPEQPEPIIVYQNGREAVSDPAGPVPQTRPEQSIAETTSQAEIPGCEFEEECYRVMPRCAEESGDSQSFMPYATEADTLRALKSPRLGLSFGLSAPSGKTEEAEPPAQELPSAPATFPEHRATGGRASQPGRAGDARAQEPEGIRARLEEILRERLPENSPPRLHLDTLEVRPSDTKGRSAGPIPF